VLIFLSSSFEVIFLIDVLILFVALVTSFATSTVVQLDSIKITNIDNMNIALTRK